MLSRALFAAALLASSAAAVPTAASAQCASGSRAIGSRTCNVSCGVDRPGGDYGQQQTNSLEACIQACGADSNCATAQYSEGNGFCYFKNSRNSAVSNSDVDTVDCDSGASSTTTTTTTTTNASPTSQCTAGANTVGSRTCNVQCGVDRAGGDYGQQQTGTLSACIQACAANPQCLTAQFSETNGFCYFKSVRNIATTNSGVDTVDCDASSSSSTTATTSSTSTTTTSASTTTTTTTTTTSLCPSPTSTVNSTTCNAQSYVYSELAGYGFIPSNARDKLGDTLGGIGSSAAIDPKSWTRNGDVYTGILWALPDRGWNTQGTLNYQNRVHKISISLHLNCSATANSSSPPNLGLTYLDTIAFTDPTGTPSTGLDADANPPYLNFTGISATIPAATYTGNGFGGNGTGGHRISVDSEGLVVNSDGSFWVSDEYGPYIYNFAANGILQSAIRPPDAFIPRRNNTDSFSANSPPIYNPAATVSPSNPTTGRANNQGFEGLTASPDGTKLYTLIQSALDQEGGTSNTGRRYARMLVYDVSTPSNPVYEAEYVVPLPTYVNNAGNTRIAAQSEIHYISATQFLILSRDSGSGHGGTYTNSIYRHIDVYDISTATNLKGATYDSFTGAVASSSGTLKSGITPATYCPWLDFNVNAQLNRFGLHNGGAQDQFLLNEKWESLAVVPVNPADPTSKEFFVFSLSDNDFITQDGYMNGGAYKYADASGYNLDNQVLVFRVTLPTSSPRIG